MKPISFPKTFILLLAVAIFISTASAQKTSLHLNVYSGRFSFGGKDATSTSRIESGFYTLPPYTLKTYGTGAAFSYALETELQRKTAQHVLYGVSFSFEKLASDVKINKVGFSGDPAYLEYDAVGHTKLINAFINFSTMAGYSFGKGKITVDVLGGADFAHCLYSRERGTAVTSNNTTFTTSNGLRSPRLDFRPRIQVKANYKKMGFLLGYSLGLTAYPSREQPQVYSRFLRVGLSYTIR